jgi:hypothetical protein
MVTVVTADTGGTIVEGVTETGPTGVVLNTKLPPKLLLLNELPPGSYMTL